MPFRFVNYKLARKVIQVSRHGGGSEVYGVNPGKMKDLYHLFMTPLVGPTKSEFAAVASNCYREIEDALEDTDGIWEEVDRLIVDDLSDPGNIEKDDIQDFMEEDDAEFLKIMDEDVDRVIVDDLSDPGNIEKDDIQDFMEEDDA